MTQLFSHAQHKVGGGDAFAQLTRELKAHHVGCEQVHRLAQHSGLGFNAAYAPSHHANTINHGGVAVSADQ